MDAAESSPHMQQLFLQGKSSGREERGTWESWTVRTCTISLFQLISRSNSYVVHSNNYVIITYKYIVKY